MGNLRYFPSAERKEEITFANQLEKELTQGDLILFEGRKSRYPILAVYENIEKDERPLINYSISFDLMGQIEIEGKNMPRIKVRKLHSTRISAITRLYHNKEEIYRYCRDKGWDEHASWIWKLEKPYEFPYLTTIQVFVEHPLGLKYRY